MKYFLIGEKLGHSFSKEIHNLIGQYDYTLKEIAKDELHTFMTKKEFDGLNVTIPYKQDVIAYLDFIDDDAKQIGAVNTIVNKNGKLYGYNTDFFGLKELIIKNKIEIKDKKVLILGTGGTSKTATQVCKALDAKEVLIVSRKSGDDVISYEMAKNVHNDANVIINTTPVGMFPNNDLCPIDDLQCFSKLEGVVDAIYNPLCSNLVLWAKKIGIKATGGLFMLVQQAIEASQLFFETQYEKELCESVYKKILDSKQNIVFVGLPGSGKTTIGSQVAKALCKTFIDTDIYISHKTGSKPNKIILEKGIDEFRKIESEAIKELSSKQNCVISTGGGAVLKEENVNYLKQNGKIIFIDRNVENIKPTEDRPLSNNIEKLKKLYNERYMIYKNCADYIVENNSSIDELKSKILKINENL